jgi:hypothetical protein
MVLPFHTASHLARSTPRGIAARSFATCLQACRRVGDGLAAAVGNAPLRTNPLTVVLLCGLVGCQGLIEPGGATPTPVGADPTWTVPALPGPCAPTRAPGVRLLTNAEVDATLALAFSTPSTLGAALPAEVAVDGYASNVGREVGSLYVDTIDTEGAKFAAQVAPTVVAALGCAGGEAEEVCVGRTVGKLGKALWRRPVSADELTALTDVFKAARGGGTQTEAVAVVLQALVGASSFLYRAELGAPDGAGLTLTAEEIAQALAYDFTGAPPDAPLLAASAAGELLQPAQREAHAARLLQTPAGRAQLARFTTQLLKTGALGQLTRDATAFPLFTPAVRDAMVEQTRLFALDTFFGPAPTAKTLWGSTSSFVNADLAAFYDLPTAGRTAAFEKVDLSVTPRRGFTGNAGVLLTHSHADGTSPVKRGLLVRTRALCKPLPPPPANVVFMIGSPDEPRTTRERFSQHTGNPACAGCHKFIDPPGFAFEGFDAIGHVRTTDGGLPVDARWTLAGTDVTTTGTGVSSLMAAAAASPQAKRCYAAQWLQWALGRALTDADACTLDEALARFDASGGDVRELLVAFASSDAFRRRVAEASP